MNDEETIAMQQHKGYWADLTVKGRSIIYGPVFDPEGVYGMAVIEVGDEHEAETVAQNDPAVSSGICTYKLSGMQIGMIRK